MPKSRPNPRLAKIHRSYTVEEIGRLYDIHKNTVREWIKAGLPTCDSKRPTLILGRELEAFLQARRMKNKRPCQPWEIYCVRCRCPKFPAGDMVDYLPVTEKLGNLIGICPECDLMIYRRVNLANLEQVREKMNVRFSVARRQVNERIQPTVNRDLE